MQTALLKIAPTGLILLMAAYCCWPYLDQPNAAMVEQTGGKTKKVTASSPAKALLRTLPKRNPFQVKENTTIASLGEVTAEAACESATDTLLAESTPEPIPEVDNVLLAMNSLALQGTSVHGHRSAAIISGNIYATGQSVEIDGVEESGLIVDQILTHRVLLQRDGQTFELGYTDTTTEPDETTSITADAVTDTTDMPSEELELELEPKMEAATSGEANAGVISGLLFRSSELAELLRQEQPPIQKRIPHDHSHSN